MDDGDGTVVRDATANNNDGEIAKGATGPSGQVLQLDGNTDWVDIDNTSATQNLATGTGAFTYEAWIKTSKTGYQTVVSVGNTTNDQESLFFLQTTGELSYHLRGSSPTITSAQKVNDGAWHHVAFVYDGSDTGTLYIDGGVDGTGTGLTNTNITGSGSVLTAAKARIGTQSTNDQEYFEGQMDTVRFWGSARTAEEIRDGMTQTYDYDTTDLLGQYTFDDVSSTTVKDNTSTQANGTLTNDALIADSGSGDAQFVNHLGNALSFDGTDDVVTFNNPIGPTGSAARTIMMWVKTSSDAAQQMISYGTAVGASSFGVGFNSWDGKGVAIDIHGAAITFEPVTATNDGQWHHYAVVVPSSASDGTVSLRDLEVYQDGVRLNSISGLAVNNDSAFNTGSGNLRLGSYIDGADDFNGQMAEASIWSTALTSSQVRDYMSRSLDGDESGLEGYWKLDEEPGSTTATDSSQNNHTGTLGGDAAFVDNAPSIEGSSIEIAENASATGQMTDVDVTGAPTYTLIGSPQLGNVDLDAASGQWTYTPNADTQGQDSFTIRASGATSGVDEETVSVDIGKDPGLSTNYGLLFDGTNDYVDLGDAGNLATGSGDFTYELWYKSSADTVRQDLITIGDQTANNSTFLHVGDTGHLQFAFYNVAGPSSTTKVADGAWHHVGVTYSSGSVQLYVDGVADGNQSGFTGVDIKDTTGGAGSSAQIGVNIDGALHPVNGELAEARIWNTARTATEIANQFDSKLNGDETGLIGYWDLDEGSGTVVTDQSGNANDGVIVGGATYKNLTTVTMGNSESYKGMILGEDPDGDNLAYAITSGSSLSGFTLNGNIYSYDSHATEDGTNEISIDITDDNGDVTTETLNFVVS